MISKGFYSIEYYLPGGWELKQVFLSQDEYDSLKDMMIVMDIPHSINLLSRLSSGVTSMDESEDS